jgi:hypothetical protein
VVGLNYSIDNPFDTYKFQKIVDDKFYECVYLVAVSTLRRAYVGAGAHSNILANCCWLLSCHEFARKRDLRSIRIPTATLTNKQVFGDASTVYSWGSPKSIETRQLLCHCFENSRHLLRQEMLMSLQYRHTVVAAAETVA